jgi:hypothetical protein
MEITQWSKKHQDDVPPGFVLGSSIDLSSWHGKELIVDLAGSMYCILGYMKKEQPNELPYYSPSVALHDANGRKSYRFVELSRGMLRRSGFLRDESYYRILDDHFLIFPRGADSYFGVVHRKDREESVELTRKVFGGTREDIETVAKALAEVIGRGYHEILQLPRVTFSRTRSNSCDLSGCLIPKDFPYLAFESSQYAWSHLSLHAFYRLLSLLCPKGSAIRRALLDSGVPEEVLNLLLKGSEEPSSPLPYPEYRE